MQTYVVDPATLATLTRVRTHDVIFPVTVVMTGNRSHDLSLLLWERDH